MARASLVRAEPGYSLPFFDRLAPPPPPGLVAARVAAHPPPRRARPPAAGPPPSRCGVPGDGRLAAWPDEPEGRRRRAVRDPLRDVRPIAPARRDRLGRSTARRRCRSGGSRG